MVFVISSTEKLRKSTTIFFFCKQLNRKNDAIIAISQLKNVNQLL